MTSVTCFFQLTKRSTIKVSIYDRIYCEVAKCDGVKGTLLSSCARAIEPSATVQQEQGEWCEISHAWHESARSNINWLANLELRGTVCQKSWVWRWLHNSTPGKTLPSLRILKRFLLENPGVLIIRTCMPSSLWLWLLSVTLPSYSFTAGDCSKSVAPPSGPTPTAAGQVSQTPGRTCNFDKYFNGRYDLGSNG